MLGSVSAGDISAEQETAPPPPGQVPVKATSVSACAVETPAAAATTVAAPNKRAILFEVMRTLLFRPAATTDSVALLKTFEVRLVKSHFLDKMA
jgi:hypothetical protein